MDETAPAAATAAAPDGFAWTNGPCGRTLVCPALGDGVSHGWTTRDLRLERPDQHSVAEWTRIAETAGVGLDDVVRLHQVHGREIIVADRRVPGRPEADGVVTARGQLALAVRTADCVPLLAAAVDGRAVAAVHAGWRGTAAGIAAAAISRLGDELQVAAAGVTVGIGPCIGPCCYRVGPDVRAAFAAAGWPPSLLERWFVADEGGLKLDLWRANRDQLVGAGVPDDRVLVSGLCTACRPDLFYSYRRDGKGTGRMVGVIAAANGRGHGTTTENEK